MTPGATPPTECCTWSPRLWQTGYGLWKWLADGGGEEFVLFAPNVTDESLAVIAVRLRMLVEKSWLDFGGDRLEVTASFGGAVSRQGETAELVVARADKQVYVRKEAGRNRIAIVFNL